MARPQGLRLHKPALSLFLSSRRISLTEAADLFGLALPVLSNLAAGRHRASIATVRAIEATAGTEVAQALFPELDGIFTAAAALDAAVA
jgi:hypothetical protein